MTMIGNPQNTMKRRRRVAREPKQTGGEAAIATPPAAANRAYAAGVEPRGTRSALLLDLLSRPEGATIAQVVTATGWLPHTARAALTGLKRKGRSITSEKPDGGERVYRITAADPASAGAADA